MDYSALPLTGVNLGDGYDIHLGSKGPFIALVSALRDAQALLSQGSKYLQLTDESEWPSYEA